MSSRLCYRARGSRVRASNPPVLHFSNRTLICRFALSKSHLLALRSLQPRCASRLYTNSPSHSIVNCSFLLIVGVYSRIVHSFLFSIFPSCRRHIDLAHLLFTPQSLSHWQMPSSKSSAKHTKKHPHHHQHQQHHQSYSNKSYTTPSTTTTTTTTKPSLHPSASYTEGYDTLSFITTHLPPATPSPPSSPGTPLSTALISSASSSSLPAVVSEYKHDDMNDAMILSGEVDDDVVEDDEQLHNDTEDDTEDEDEDVEHLVLASSTLPSAPSISFLIPQYDKLHQPSHSHASLSPPPSHSTPLLHRTSSNSSSSSSSSNSSSSSTLQRKLRKLLYFASNSSVLLIGSCIFLMLLSGVNSLLWVNISTRYGLQHAYLLDQLSGLLFLIFLVPVVLLRSSSLSTLSLSSFLSPPLLLVGFLDAPVRSVYNTRIITYTRPIPAAIVSILITVFIFFLFTTRTFPSALEARSRLSTDILIFTSRYDT